MTTTIEDRITRHYARDDLERVILGDDVHVACIASVGALVDGLAKGLLSASPTHTHHCHGINDLPCTGEEES